VGLPHEDGRGGSRESGMFWKGSEEKRGDLSSAQRKLTGGRNRRPRENLLFAQTENRIEGWQGKNSAPLSELEVGGELGQGEISSFSRQESWTEGGRPRA